jgi:hypothetical protein
MSIFVIQVWYIDEYIEDVRADIVFVLIWQLLIVMCDVEFGYKVKKVDFFYFAGVGEMIE